MSKTSNYKKEQIIAAALELVRKGGEEALTARSLGAAMGCSTSPLFTVCGNLEEIRKAVHKAAVDEFVDYVKDAVNYIPAFKEYGMRLVKFAIEQPNIYRLAFLSADTASDALNPVAIECLKGITEEYKLTDEQTQMLLDQVWTFSCGLATLAISGAVVRSEEEISDMLTLQFTSTLMFIKSGHPMLHITPRLRKEGEGSALPMPDNCK